MKINQFRFLTPNETFVDKSYHNWSRGYEWGYVLDYLKDKSQLTVHNTCCGQIEIHKQFATALSETNCHIVNSEVNQSRINQTFDNFTYYDLLTPCDTKFDLVLCISTLEEIPEHITTIYNNLLDSVKPGGRLIITCDYPDVEVELLEGLLGQKCQTPEIKLNGENSYHQDLTYKHLNVILIDITKQ